jgi:hypothetical protein
MVKKHKRDKVTSLASRRSSARLSPPLTEVEKVILGGGLLAKTRTVGKTTATDGAPSRA